MCVCVGDLEESFGHSFLNQRKKFMSNQNQSERDGNQLRESERKKAECESGKQKSTQSTLVTTNDNLKYTKSS